MCALRHFRLGDRALDRGRAGAERRAANSWSPWSPVLADSEARRCFLFGTWRSAVAEPFGNSRSQQAGRRAAFGCARTLLDFAIGRARPLLKSSSERVPRSASDGRFLAHARAAPRPAVSSRRRRRGAIGSAAARPDRKRWPRGSVACVRSGISGWVIGLLIVGVRAPNGARPIPGRPGRRCWPTARPAAVFCLGLGDRRWRSPSATAARNRLAGGKPSDVLARCWILQSAARDRSLNLHLKGCRVPPLMVVSSRTRGRPLGQRFRAGGAGAELSGRPRHDPIESAGRGGLWRVCAPAFQAG